MEGCDLYWGGLLFSSNIWGELIYSLCMLDEQLLLTAETRYYAPETVVLFSVMI
jgi:hypothetical protein